jgi:hypothetical protein
MHPQTINLGHYFNRAKYDNQSFVETFVVRSEIIAWVMRNFRLPNFSIGKEWKRKLWKRSRPLNNFNLYLGDKIWA